MKKRLEKNINGYMKLHIKENIKNHTKKYIREYLIFTMILLIGIIIGIVVLNNTGDEQKQQINNYMLDFTESIRNNSKIDRKRLQEEMLKDEKEENIKQKTREENN